MELVKTCLEFLRFTTLIAYWNFNPINQILNECNRSTNKKYHHSIFEMYKNQLTSFSLNRRHGSHLQFHEVNKCTVSDNLRNSWFKIENTLETLSPRTAKFILTPTFDSIGWRITFELLTRMIKTTYRMSRFGGGSIILRTPEGLCNQQGLQASTRSMGTKSLQKL